MSTQTNGRAAIVVLALVCMSGCPRRPSQNLPAGGVPDAGPGVAPGEALTRDDVVKLIDESPLSRVAAELKALIRTAVAIEPKAVAEDRIEVGASKIGGLPDLPAGTDWPEWGGVPLAFIAQFRLADVVEYDVEDALPESGMLHFFYDGRLETWGLDPEDRGSWRVLYVKTDATPLARCPMPDGLPEESRFRACEVDFSTTANLPPYDAADIQALELTEKEQDSYMTLLDGVMGAELEGSKLLGHPDSIQADMQEGCQLASTGGSADPDTFEPAQGATDWRLLLQIDSEDQAEMMWGDAGMIYYWVRKQDLQARKFDAVWMVLQCY